MLDHDTGATEVTGAEYGEIVLKMLENASFPGSESERVTALKELSKQLKEGAKMIMWTKDSPATPIKK